MELEQLRQLTAIKEWGTISAAAEELRISQPALSRSMQRLEKDIGEPLFERRGNRIVFNEAGELAVHHAQRILADIRVMRNDFDELSKRTRALVIASVAPAPTWRLTALVVERFPGTILDPRLVSERDAETSILDHRADLSITLHPMALPGIRTIPLMTEDLSVLVPNNNPLAQRESVSFAELNGHPFLVYSDIGFWMDVVNKQIPDSHLAIQHDRQVFMQMIRGTSDMLCFTTDAPQNADIPANRTPIPIKDAAAHATFFLACAANAPRRAKDIMDWVSRQTPSKV